MSQSPMSLSGQLVRLAAIGIVLLVLAACFAFVGGWLDPQRLSPRRIINAMEQNSGVFAGYRRAHSKGLCISGYFDSNGAAAELSQAQVFSKGRTQVLGRFSVPVGSPYAPDTSVPVRSMALAFLQGDGQQWRTAMNTPPVLAVSTPQAFFEQIEAARPVPSTGKPDPARMQAFFAAHPESAEFRQWAKAPRLSSSFANSTFNSINAFRLLDAQGKAQAVRWRMQPEAGFAPLPSEQSDPESLQHELLTRLEQGPARWQLILTLAQDGDAVNDPARSWPVDRREVDAGTLVIERAEQQIGGACHDLTFDPLVLPTGIEPTDDPVLLARSSAYAESFKRRTAEGAPQPKPAQGATP